jgi:hypothetical protein
LNLSTDSALFLICPKADKQLISEKNINMILSLISSENLRLTARRLVAVFGAEPTKGRGHYFF